MYPDQNLLSRVERLSWPRFSSDGARRAELICATENFFVISGYGAFVPGYILIVTKNTCRALSALSRSNYYELKWLINLMTKLIAKCYDKPVVLFEHGMCGCTNADNAHMHIFPISCEVKPQDIIFAVDKVLDQRGIGIKDEIDKALRRQMRSTKSNQEVLTFDRIRKLSVSSYPQICSKLQSYVYFKTPFSESSFLTDANLGSQVGREIIFEIEKEHNISLKDTCSNLDDNQGKLIWRWQDFEFKENVMKTRNDLLKFVDNLAEFGIERKFSFKAISHHATMH